MNTPAKIDLTSNLDGKIIAVRSDGEVYFQNDTAYIEFDTTDNTHTCIGISPDLVTLSCMGDHNYTMILEEGKVSNFDMESSEGKLSLFANALKVRSKISKHSITLTLVYGLGLPLGEVYTTIKLKCEF